MPLPNFSLREFNMLAVGKYNAGLVDFGTDETTGRTKLVKVNDHTPLSRKIRDKLSRVHCNPLK